MIWDFSKNGTHEAWWPSDGMLAHQNTSTVVNGYPCQAMSAEVLVSFQQKQVCGGDWSLFKEL